MVKLRPRGGRPHKRPPLDPRLYSRTHFVSVEEKTGDGEGSETSVTPGVLL